MKTQIAVTVMVVLLNLLSATTFGSTVPTHTWSLRGTTLYIGASIAPAPGSCSEKDWEWNAGNFLRGISLPSTGTESAEFKLATQVPWEALVSAPNRNFTYYLGKPAGGECIFGTVIKTVAIIQSDKTFASADVEWGYVTKGGSAGVPEHNRSGNGVGDESNVGVRDLRFLSPVGCAYKVYFESAVPYVGDWAKSCPTLTLWYRVTSKAGVILGEARLDVPVGATKPRSYALGLQRAERPGEVVLEILGAPNQAYRLWSAENVNGPWVEDQFPVQTGTYLCRKRQEFFKLDP